MLAHLRRFAVWLALLALASHAHAACQLDGQATLGTTYNHTFPTRTIGISTIHANDLLIMHVGINSENRGSPNYVPFVTGITGAGVTWKKRISAGNFIPSCWFFGDCWVASEVWYAVAPAAISPSVVTVNVSTPDVAYASLSFFAIHNSSAFDANGSLPRLATNYTTSTAAIQVPGVSTNSANTWGLTFCDFFGPGVGSFACSVQAGPWANINGISQQNLFISFGLATGDAFLALPAAVSGVTFAPYATAENRWIAIGDAVVCGSAGSFSNVQINE
jgi:hypothetical protein